jgi:sulfite reductase (NADPH) hemoprotein beta-component
MLVQRDFDDRINRKHARLKYTIDDRSVEWFREEVESRLGYKPQPSREFTFHTNGDKYGWTKGVNDNREWAC